jgi:glycosyltransferase involved in cell wall biosynthesis
MEEIKGSSANPPAIAIIIRTLGIGGAEKQSILLANNLSDHYNVHLIVQYGNVIDEKHAGILNKESVILHKLNGSWLSKLITIYKLIRKAKVKVIFPYLMSDNIIAFLVSVFNSNTKVAGGIRNCYLPKSKYIVLKGLHHINHSVTIFNNTSGREDFVKRGYTADKSIVILNCIENIHPPIEREPTKNVNLITVGRFVAQKDYFTALKAFRLLVDDLGNQYNLRYTIVGYGELENQIREEISRLNLGNFVALAIKPKDVPSFYEKAHIYLCSSLFEGVSNSIMEAMNYSLPIVATNVGDNNLLVNHGSNGFLVNPGKEAELFESAKTLIENYDLRNGFGKRSNHILKEKFGEEKFKTDYHNLILKLTGS